MKSKSASIRAENGERGTEDTHSSLQGQRRLSDDSTHTGRFNRNLGTIAIFFVCSQLGSAASNAATYRTQALEAPAPFVAFYTAQITDAGMIPGFARKQSTPELVPTTWQASTGEISFLTPGSLENGAAESVRDDGVIIGSVRTFEHDGYASPAVFAGGMRRLLPLPGGIGAAKLTHSNTIIGVWLSSDGTETDLAFWENEEFVGLFATLPGVSVTPVAINGHGRYVGVYSGSEGYGGFVGNGLDVRVLTLPGFPEPRALGINDSNTISGIYLPDGQKRVGYIAREDGLGNYTATALLPLPGEVESPVWEINNAGDMVGLSTTSINGDETATIYYAGSITPIDMNTLIDPIPGVKLVRGIDINNHGQILVEGAGPTGYTYYVLTPIPEPSLAGFALLALARSMSRRCRRR